MAQQGSYRDWMKTGITFTGNADQDYVGHKAGDLGWMPSSKSDPYQPSINKIYATFKA
ncbi:MAG: hypothetical protein IPO60_06410 [Flavobacteriales bacterium]|nr:hypothetical protein [Flavobacteriales bacterium]MBK9597953.1 hypothetical protein [Flavobacteriales bacterium]